MQELETITIDSLLSLWQLSPTLPNNSARNAIFGGIRTSSI